MYGLVELLRRAFIEEGGVLYDDPLTPHITWYLQFEKHKTSTIKYDPTIKPQTHLYLNKTGWLILFAITPFSVQVLAARTQDGVRRCCSKRWPRSMSAHGDDSWLDEISAGVFDDA